MGSKKWDPYRGCFVAARDYDERVNAKREELEKAWEEFVGDDPSELLDKELDTKGMRLFGGLWLKGDKAREVIGWLDEHGYKDFRYSYRGTLVKVLPEDKSYAEWVMEAIYWYGKECGMPLGNGDPVIPKKVKQE